MKRMTEKQVKNARAMGISEMNVLGQREARSRKAEEATAVGILNEMPKGLPEQEKPFEIVKSKRIKGIVYVKDNRTKKWAVALGVRALTETRYKSLLHARIGLRWKWKEISIVIAAAAASLTHDLAALGLKANEQENQEN